MKNKFRRSMTSVLLAASLLFSSQSVIAFADYGSKSDASDLSPVQESVEPVIGESQAMMAAAPMNMEPNSMFPGWYDATITIDVRFTDFPDFSAEIPLNELPGKNKEHSFHTHLEVGCDDIHVQNDGHVTGEWEWYFYHYFTISYKADQQNGGQQKTYWVKVVLNPTNDPSDDVEDPNSNDSWKDQISVNLSCDTDQTHQDTYKLSKGKYTVDWTEGSKEATVSITDEQGQEWVDKYYNDHTYVSCSPEKIELVWDDESKDSKWHCGGGSDEQGHWDVLDDNKTFKIEMHCDKTPEEPTVKPDLTNVKVQVVCNTDSAHSVNPISLDEKYYTEHTWNPGDKEYTITINNTQAQDIIKASGISDGHVSFNDSYTITFKWLDDKWTLDNTPLSENTSITITTVCTPVPTPVAPDYTNIKVSLKCWVDGNHMPTSTITLDEGTYTSTWDEATKPTKITVTLNNAQDYVNSHKLNEKDHPVLKATPYFVELEWKQLNDGTYGWTWNDVAIDPTSPAIINVETVCVRDLDVTKLNYQFDCLNTKDTIIYNPVPLSNELVEVNFINDTTVNVALKQDALAIPENHVLVSSQPEYLTMIYENGQWKNDDPNKNTFTVEILCGGPTIEQINEQLNAQIVCVNNDAKHQKTASFDNLLDSSFDVTNLKNDESFITCEVVVKPSLYLDKFYNISGGIKHSVVIGNKTYPVNPDGSVTVRFNYTKDTGWKLLYPTKNMVTFPVECTTEKPVTPPTENQVKALFKGLVNVKCSTNTNHSSLNYDITEFDIGDAWAVVPQNNSETPSVSFVDVTINQTATYFFNQYNSDTGHASTSYSGSVPASIRLMFNNETEQWEIYSPTGTINLTVTCSTGGTITPTPGGNGGDNDDDDDRYTGGNTVTRTINDDDVPLNDRPTNTTTIDDEDVPLADLPDDTVTIDDGEVPLKANPSTGDSLPFAAMAAAALSLGGVIVLNRKKK